MRSDQLTPILKFNPKLSANGLRLFLYIAEHDGIVQADISRLLDIPKSTVSRQVSILSDRTEKGTQGMSLVSKQEIKIDGHWCSKLKLTQVGQQIYESMI